MDLLTVKIVPDSVTLSGIKGSPDASGEVFKISIDSLHIDGIGIEDLLRTDQLKLKTISVTGPVVEMYQVKKLPGENKNDTSTLYQKLMKQMKRISIDEILVQHGIWINHNFRQKSQPINPGDIEIRMHHILIDSSTQFDKERFLFAEEARITVRNLKGRTEDSLYVLNCGSINISTRENSITALDISVVPRYTRKEFESKLSARKYMFKLNIPKLTLSRISWWQIMNGKSVIAKEAVIENGACDVYLDRSLPFRRIKPNNFPHQILMRTPIPFSVAKMVIRHAKFLYTEYNPGMGQTGNIVISDVNGTAVNITNIRKEIKKNRFMVSTSSGAFMNRVPMNVGFHFDLSQYKKGNFSMDLMVGGLDSSILNPITGPLAEFVFRRGSIQKGVVHIEGNNLKATGKGVLLYKNLYLESLKKNDRQPGKIKKRKLLSFIGNVFLIKNSNPSKGRSAREETFGSERNDHQPFFSLVWKTIFIGVLKSFGLPAGFASKPY